MSLFFLLRHQASPVPQQESVFFVTCQCLIIEVHIVNYTLSCIMGQKIRNNTVTSILCSLPSHSWEFIRLLYTSYMIGWARGLCDLANVQIPQPHREVGFQILMKWDNANQLLLYCYTFLFVKDIYSDLLLYLYT